MDNFRCKTDLGLIFWQLVLIGFGAAARIPDCPAAQPCLCNGAVIDCSRQRFVSVPAFQYSTAQYRTLKLNLNNITAILQSAFASIAANNVSEIDLTFNHISTIDHGAFASITSTLTTLNLSHNRLKSLPSALGKLTKIADLDISYNPIDGYQTGSHGHYTHTDGFTDPVMREIGDSVSRLKFGDDFLLHWPRSLHHLVQLRELFADGSSIRVLQSGAFHGFEHTLTDLTIAHSNFAQFPIEVGNLDKLEELHFDHNRELNGNSVIIDTPFMAINKTLKVLSLNYDHLTIVPEVLKYLGLLQNISLDGNPLEFISDEAIRFIENTRVQMLSFRDCGLKRLPGSLSDLNNILELDFSQNHIKTIESVDLSHIPSLQTLILARNPLKYISRDSFNDLSALSVLDMTYTSVEEVPKSIAYLASLKILDVQHARIECTCDLVWLRRLMDSKPSLVIKGDCITIDRDIQTYVQQRVLTCLDYQAFFG